MYKLLEKWENNPLFFFITNKKALFQGQLSSIYNKNKLKQINNKNINKIIPKIFIPFFKMKPVNEKNKIIGAKNMKKIPIAIPENAKNIPNVNSINIIIKLMNKNIKHLLFFLVYNNLKINSIIIWFLNMLSAIIW